MLMLLFMLTMVSSPQDITRNNQQVQAEPHHAGCMLDCASQMEECCELPSCELCYVAAFNRIESSISQGLIFTPFLDPMTKIDLVTLSQIHPPPKNTYLKQTV